MLASLCITSQGDFKGVPTDECAVRLVKAGKRNASERYIFDMYKTYAEKATLNAHEFVLQCKLTKKEQGQRENHHLLSSSFPPRSSSSSPQS